MIRIIGAPFDGGGPKLGSRLGPEAIRLADLEPELASIGISVEEWVMLPSDSLSSEGSGLRNFDAFYCTMSALKSEVSKSIQAGELPVMLGGEHSLAAGSIQGAMEVIPSKELAVLWIDAHADINTPGSSLSGNLHGMPLAAICGLSTGVSDLAVEQQWKSMSAKRPLKLNQVAWLGLRDVDLGERHVLARTTDSPRISMFDVDREGIPAQIKKIQSWLKEIGAKHLWISFDVDVMDPILAPGTGTAVRGGLSYREAHMVAELIYQMLHGEGCDVKLCGLDVVEVNPLQDHNNQTAKMAVEWVCSLFGKTILGVPHG